MKLFWPIAHPGVDEPAMSQQFGQGLLDYAQFGLKGHNGIDFPAPLGTPIHAVHDGWIIEQTSRDTGFGLRITQLIQDENDFYLVVYGHMERLENPTDIPYNFYNRGNPVKTGDVIGYVDSTGFSTGNHLHLGLYPYDANGVKLLNNGYGGAIDPIPFLREKETMQLIKVNGVVYLSAGTNNKVVTGIADGDVLAGLFGDEPIVDLASLPAPETQTLAKGFVIHKK